MVKKHMKSADGFYHINGRKYEMLIGSRAQVQHDTAYKTPGNLTKDKLLMNKHGRIVSKKKHMTAKKDNRLVKAGFHTKKGKFGFIKSGEKHTRSKHTRSKHTRSKK
jgi:hypothetical protein